jgi:hypothetical protein
MKNALLAALLVVAAIALPAAAQTDAGGVPARAARATAAGAAPATAAAAATAANRPLTPRELVRRARAQRALRRGTHAGDRAGGRAPRDRAILMHDDRLADRPPQRRRAAPVLL